MTDTEAARQYLRAVAPDLPPEETDRLVYRIATVTEHWLRTPDHRDGPAQPDPDHDFAPDGRRFK